MIEACDACLRRSHLVGFLAGDVQRLIPPGAPARAHALALQNEALVAAAPPARRAEARRYLDAFDPARAREGIEAAGLDACCGHSSEYPGALRELKHPPPVLYAAGLARLLAVDEPAAALIGTRRPSEYGRTVAYGLGRDLGRAGVPVVSGLALGIDAVGHRGCLDGSGFTVAVLASGPDVAYPRTNRQLYRRIRREGTIVSEMPPGSRPYRWLFPARNRIMAALARLTVVVEATSRSGTLITADCAAELGREVAAVPGWVTADVAAGTNGLLRSGAAVVTGAQDVLDLLFGVGVRELAGADPLAGLAPTDARVAELIGAGAAVDEIAAATDIAPGQLRASLARLELAGAVRRAPTGDYLPATQPRAPAEQPRTSI